MCPLKDLQQMMLQKKRNISSVRMMENKAHIGKISNKKKG